MWNMENMIRTFELKDTGKEVEFKVITPLWDSDNDEMLDAYTDYLIGGIKQYHEDIEHINTLDDLLLVEGDWAEEEKENKITYSLHVWRVKEEFYNQFSDNNYIVACDKHHGPNYAFEDDYKYLGLVTVQCEYSIEDY